MKEQLNKSVHNPVHTAIASGVVSLAVGATVGYILGKKRKSVKTEVVQPELNFNGVKTVKDLPTGDNRRPPKVIIPAEHPVFAAPEATDEDTVITIEPVGPEFEELNEVVAHNVFAGNDSDWNYEEEVKHRTEFAPYVLHRDEYFEDEKDYAQLTLMYYAGDDILTNTEDDSPIYSYHDIVGDLKFGHGSGDPKVFYVRNDKRHAEYEIIHDPGLYSVEVLGHEIEDNARVQELKHSKVPKFRMD